MAAHRAGPRAGPGQRGRDLSHRGGRRRSRSRGAGRNGGSVWGKGRARFGGQRLPVEGGACPLERPRGPRRIRRVCRRRCAVGRGADTVCGDDRAGQRDSWAFPKGPEAGHGASLRGRRIIERRGRRRGHPLRDQAEAGRMSDPSPLSGQALAAVAKPQTTTELEAIALEYLGRKSGKLSSLLSGIGKLEPAERARLGQAANEAKKAIEAALATRRAELEGARLADIAETEAIDITFPGPPLGRGHIHVLTQVRRQIETVLESLGYQVEQGPEVETEWYNFEALNLGTGHPARGAWDSFCFTPDLLLRAPPPPLQLPPLAPSSAP